MTGGQMRFSASKINQLRNRAAARRGRIRENRDSTSPPAGRFMNGEICRQRHVDSQLGPTRLRGADEAAAHHRPRHPLRVIIHFQGVNMRKAVLAVATALSFAGGLACADPVHDWHDLDKVHHHVQEAIHEMEHARAANHYDMAGHGAKAEELMRQAERELHEAIEAARAAR
jgi:hypothetical protein